VLVVSHENITNNWYPGNDRSMLLPNCIFRCNGAAMLLTNKPKEARCVQKDYLCLKHSSLFQASMRVSVLLACMYTAARRFFKQV
jgi:hypothetical protein